MKKEIIMYVEILKQSNYMVSNHIGYLDEILNTVDKMKQDKLKSVRDDLIRLMIIRDIIKQFDADYDDINPYDLNILEYQKYLHRKAIIDKDIQNIKENYDFYYMMKFHELHHRAIREIEEKIENGCKEEDSPNRRFVLHDDILNGDIVSTQMNIDMINNISKRMNEETLFSLFLYK